MERKKLGPITLCKNFADEVVLSKKMLKYLLGGCSGSGSDSISYCYGGYLANNGVTYKHTCGVNRAYCVEALKLKQPGDTFYCN